jgi:hypothetical protein
MRVYKYRFEPASHFDLLLPKGAEILKAGKQGDAYCLWALVDIDAKEQVRHFRWAGTGHDIIEVPENLRHVSTFFDDLFVWHVFEILG